MTRRGRPSGSLDDAPAAAAAKDLSITKQGRTPLTREQHSFNRLLADVQALRRELEAWRDFEERYRRSVLSKLVPLQAQLHAARRDLILACDGILDGRLGGGVSGKVERKNLVAFVLGQCELHLADVPGDDAVVAVHDRYSAIAFADMQALERDAARELAQDVFGVDLDDDLEAGSLEEMLDAARRRAEADARAAAEERETLRRQRQSAKARRKEAEHEAKAERAAKEVSQSIRDVYRKLASALHPDRAVDEADRARRHGLMQRVNQAYEGTDLLALLQLQLEIEQIDASHLGTLSQARLRHYNQVLGQQVAELNRELQDVMMGLRTTIPDVPHVITPQSVERNLKRDVAAVKRDIAALREHAQALLRPDYRRDWLKEEERLRRADLREASMLEELFDSGVDLDFPDEWSKPRKRRRSRRR